MIAWLKLVEGIHARKEDVPNENFLQNGKKMAARENGAYFCVRRLAKKKKKDLVNHWDWLIPGERKSRLCMCKDVKKTLPDDGRRENSVVGESFKNCV